MWMTSCLCGGAPSPASTDGGAGTGPLAGRPTTAPPPKKIYKGAQTIVKERRGASQSESRTVSQSRVRSGRARNWQLTRSLFCYSCLYVFNKDSFVSLVVMFEEDSGNRSTACGLEAGTPETAVTNTTICTFGGEEVQLPTVPSTHHTLTAGEFTAQKNSGQVSHILFASVTKQYKFVLAYRRWHLTAGKVTVGLAESNDSLSPPPRSMTIQCMRVTVGPVGGGGSPPLGSWPCMLSLAVLQADCLQSRISSGPLCSITTTGTLNLTQLQLQPLQHTYSHCSRIKSCTPGSGYLIQQSQTHKSTNKVQDAVPH